MNDLFEKIINHALAKKTTDIHILLKDNCNISFRILGELQKYTTLQSNLGSKLINYIRFKSNIDINYHLKPQTGHLNFLLNNQVYYLRVSSLPGNDVDSMVIRILNNHDTISLDELSVFDYTKDILRDIIERPSGLFIVSGATGSGKSTTLYTLLDEINKVSKKNIVTLEDPIEIKKDYCLQIQLNEQMGITYEDSLKQILRHDPDVIMIGEIRDKKTAKLAITCALTGHLVLTTIHASDCVSSIKRLINLEVLELDIKEVLVGIMSQKMLYNKSLNKPVILSEIMNKKNLFNYFEFNQLEHLTFKDNAKYLVENKLVDNKQVMRYLNE